MTEIDKEWCAVAGVQMVMALHGTADLGESFQRELAGRIDEWESRRDSLNGGWGPSAMVKALAAYDVPGYEVRAYKTRGRRAQGRGQGDRPIPRPGPAPRLARRAHLGHDRLPRGRRPARVQDARISGAYILDPWYPRVSSIWGASDPPGTSRTRTRCAATTSPGSVPRATTRIATGCSSPSCPPRRSTARRRPRPRGRRPPRRPPARTRGSARAGSATRARSPGGPCAPRSRPRTRAGSRSTPTPIHEGERRADRDREPGDRGQHRQQRVVGRVQAARGEVAERVERDGERERREDHAGDARRPRRRTRHRRGAPRSRAARR